MKSMKRLLLKLITGATKM